MSQESIVFNEDCVEGVKKYPDGWFNLCVVDPPYGIDFQSAWRIERKRKAKIQNDLVPFIDWIEPLFNKMSEGSGLICFYRFDVQDEFINEIKRCGFDIKGQCVWDKVIHGMGDLESGVAPQHELFIYATKGKRLFPNGRPLSIFKSQRCSPNEMIHPNEKPVHLYKKILTSFAFKNDKIIDLFVGSGNSRIASQQNNLSYTGFELDKDYYDAQEKRFNNFKSQLTMF